MRRSISRRRTAAVLVTGALGLAVLQAPATAAPAAGAPNTHAGFLQVAVNNVENLPTVDLACPGDWQDLVYYLDQQEYRPDIFLVQQISDRAQLDDYLDRLSAQFGETYKGVIAEQHPAAMNSPCGAPKDYQTNAVIYRAARFTLESDPSSVTKRWQAQADLGQGCVNNNQARTKAVKVRLHDKIADKDVTAASVHWPTGNHGGTPCTASNAKEDAAEMTEDGFGGSLLLFGGDANSSDRTSAGDYRGWYKSLNGDLSGQYGYRDALYDHCAAAAGTTEDCLSDNWTIGGSRRIDFLFAKKSGGGVPSVTDAHTITFNEGDAADLAATGTDRQDRNYSDHRSVRARVYY
jgi:hypothetical protein